MFSSDQIEHLTQQWKNALIKKLTAGHFDTLYLRSILLSLRKLRAEAEILHLGLRFYVIHSLLIENRVKIITTVWRFGRNPILMCQWHPNLFVQKAITEVVTTIWINLPLLSIEYHSHEAMIAIGNLIGRIAALDASHERTLQASSIRICVKCDISAKLRSQIQVNRLSQQVIYESLNFTTSLGL